MGLFDRTERRIERDRILAKYTTQAYEPPTPYVVPTVTDPTWLRSFTYGLADSVSEDAASSGAVILKTPKTADVDVDLLESDDQECKGDYKALIFELSSSDDREDSSGYDHLRVNEILDWCLGWLVENGTEVQEGQVIGVWCDDDIVAPASGQLVILAWAPSPDDEPEGGSIEGFPDTEWLWDQHATCDFSDAAVHHGFGWTVAVVLVDENALPIPEVAGPPVPVLREAPEPVLIRHPSDAEEAAARWMRYWGWEDARTTPPGADEGIDVVSEHAIAQVKAYMNPVGRPEIQNLFGVASAEGKVGLFFALTGYTAEAEAWADKAGVGLFRFDLQGQPEPVNTTARLAIDAQ